MVELRTLIVGLAVAIPAGLPAQLHFTNITEDTGMWHVPTAWGVTAVDVDHDGDIDLLTANNGSENALFVNEGNLHFRGRPIIGGSPSTEALVPGDIDGGGNLDLFFSSWGGPNAILAGDGEGGFREITMETGYQPAADCHCAGAGLADIDADGDLDLYLPDFEHGDSIHLNGGGVFTDVTEIVGLPLAANSEGCVFADLNGDGLLDVYVPRADTTSCLYLSRGEGQFEPLCEATDAFTQDAQVFSLPFDADGDGDLDLLLVRGRFQEEGAANVLLTSIGDGEFVDTTPPEWQADPRRYHSASAGDVDNDGDLDVFTASVQGCALWLNDGEGGFSLWEEDVDWTVVPGCGTVMCDLDEDGDIDILVRARPTDELQVEGEFLFRNDLNDGNWLKVRPVDARGGRYCHGAQVRVYRAGGLGQAEQLVARRDITSACGWGSYGPFEAHFGLPSDETYDIEVRYVDGSQATQTAVQAGQEIEVAPEQ